MADDGKPCTVAGFLNGPGAVLELEGNDFSGSRAELTEEQATDPEFLQEALIAVSSETHSGDDVVAWARGPFAHLLGGTVEQNYIFHVMHHAVTAE